MSTCKVNEDTLKNILNKILGISVVHADYQTKQLQGGTVGDVQLITGTAKSADGTAQPYNVVLKIQKKWERHADPGSWRREYDLYKSDLGIAFSSTLRWPECYHLEMNDKEDEFQLWLEYIDGVTGSDLTVDMLEKVAEVWGRFQGKLFAEHSSILKNFANLSGTDYLKNFYRHYRGWDVVYNYIRSDDCQIPKHLCQMIIDLDNNSDEIFSRIENLPIVFCHRDLWVTNIFYSDGKIALIDWDTTGWGYLGEDIASLIADELDVDDMVECYHKCIPAYYRGFSEYVDVAHISDHCIYEIILAMYAYREVEWFLYDEEPGGKELHLATLQKMYEMKASDADGGS